jgi:hypothetical protein
VLFVVSSPDTERLAASMAEVRAAIYAMDAGWGSVPGLNPGDANNPSYVSEPIPLPDGQLVMVDFGHVPPDLRAELPEVVSTVLTSAGIDDATIAPAPTIGERYSAIDRMNPLSRAWLRGLDPPDRPRFLPRPPDPVMSTGRQWLLGERQEGDELVALAISVEVPLTEDQFEPVVSALAGSRAPLPNPTPVVATDFDSHGACASFGVLHGFGALLSVGGAKWSAADLAASMNRQRDLIRANTEHLSWATIVVEPGDRSFDIPQTQITETDDPPFAWYRLFSPAQLDRIGGPPPGSVELAGGRVELSRGDAEAFLSSRRT